MPEDADSPKLELERIDLAELGEVVDGREFSTGYLDPATGEVWPAMEDPDAFFDAFDDNEGDADERGWIPVGGEGSRRAYRDMEIFAEYVEQRDLRTRLQDALHGRGAFRRFRDVIWNAPEQVLTEWERYRKLGQQRRGVRWLVGRDLVDERAAGARDEAITAEMDAILTSMESTQPSKVVDLQAKLGQFSQHWSPKVVARLNDYEIKLVKIQGEFVWHTHEETDELFLVLDGRLTIQLRDGDVTLGPGQLYVVPRGVEHCPISEGETAAMLIEPAGTVNTGGAGGELTAERDESLLD